MMRRLVPKTHWRDDRGLSLIELVVAMALFGLVATLGTQGLTGMLRLRDNLNNRSVAAAEVARATSLLRHDLANAVPMPFFTPGGGRIRSALVEEPQGFSLSIGGQPTLDAVRQPAPVFHRVEWRFQPISGLLLRQRWATLTPLNSAALGPEVTVLSGVTEMRARSYWGALGWVDGLRIPLSAVPDPTNLDEDGGPVAATSFSSALPDGVEITIVTEDLGEITLLEALK